MSIADTLTVLSAAAMTLAMLSYLWRENMAFRIAEHAFIGVAAGWGALLYADSAWRLLQPWLTAGYWYAYLTVLIGLLYLFFFSDKHFWVYRYPTAIVLGVDIGVMLARSIKTQFLDQIRDTINITDLRIVVSGTTFAFLNDAVVAVGVVCALFYFYATREHTGPLRYVSKIGTYFLMAGFGASFGVTVMARISLLIGRLRFLYFTYPAYYMIPVALVLLIVGIANDRRKAAKMSSEAPST